jgi:adenine deaminase
MPFSSAFAIRTALGSDGAPGECVLTLTDGPQRKRSRVLPLPLAALVSCQGFADFADLRAAIDRSVDWRPPYLVFKACFGATLACNAGPRQTDRGIADVSAGSAS